jgi:lysophospholipase L1-like esterase
VLSTETTAIPKNDLAAGLKQLAPKLCVAVTIFVLLLGLGELGSYVYLRLNQRPLPYADLPVPADYLREIQDSMKHQYLPFVQFRRQPYHGHYISVDQEGVRQTLSSQCNDTGSLQIWMFGDSVLWGTGVVDRDTIPSQLARLYNDSGRSTCVKNFAEQAWTSTQELVELLLRLKRDRPPDFVVFYDGTDEIILPQANAPKDIDQTYYRVRDLLETSQEESKPGLRFLQRTNTVRALNLLSQQIHSWFSKTTSSLSPAEAENIAQSSMDSYEMNLQVVDALSRAYGFQPVYFWYPTSSVGKKPLTAEERDSIRREIQKDPVRFQLKQAAYEICRKIHRPDFLYLGDTLDDKPTWFYLDAVHLTPEGNQIMAEKIFQVLTKTKTGASR